MNSKELLEMSLNLPSPWYVEDVKFHPPKDNDISGRIVIYLNFTRGYKFTDSKGNQTTAHDTVERKWRHLDFFQHECTLIARLPRLKLVGGGIETVQVPWSREGSGFTLLYEATCLLFVENEMPVKKASKMLRLTDTRLWRIIAHWVNKARENDDQHDVTELGIDETSVTKGHQYVTVGVDMKKKRVIFVTKGKSSKCIDKLKDHLISKGCPPEQINQVCIDMSPAFISGVKTNFPEAELTFDRFHVNIYINKAMDELRKEERRKILELKGSKYIFLKNDNKLTKRQAVTKHHLLSSYPRLGEGYRLKELFNDFWSIKIPEDAAAYLSYWCDLAEESGIKSFVEVVKTIKNHWDGIMNYIKSKLNNGILEGINSKIQLAKKRARGYRNIDNFITMIHLVAGKLKFDYPL